MKLKFWFFVATVCLQLAREGNGRSIRSVSPNEPIRRAREPSMEEIKAILGPIVDRLQPIVNKAIEDGHYPSGFFESDDWKEFTAALRAIQPNAPSDEEMIRSMNDLLEQNRQDESDESEDDEEEEEEEEEDDNEEQAASDLAIFSSPQWRALMVLTATKADMNDPKFVSTWVDKSSSREYDDSEPYDSSDEDEEDEEDDSDEEKENGSDEEKENGSDEEKEDDSDEEKENGSEEDKEDDSDAEKEDEDNDDKRGKRASDVIN